jgi:hypothetical protein
MDENGLVDGCPVSDVVKVGAGDPDTDDDEIKALQIGL